jgi:uncharacterized protein YndB with AHSA1/START domain
MKRTMITLAAGCYALTALSTAALATSPSPATAKAPAKRPITQTRSLTVEFDVPQSPEKVWGALTQSPIIAKWLMKNDFKPVVGHAFKFSADWGTVDGKVLAVEPEKKLSYTWVAYGLNSVVNWTITPTSKGTHLRMVQSGFPTRQPQFYEGAQGGWEKFTSSLKQVLSQ